MCFLSAILKGETAFILETISRIGWNIFIAVLGPAQNPAEQAEPLAQTECELPNSECDSLQCLMRLRHRTLAAGQNPSYATTHT